MLVKMCSTYALADAKGPAIDQGSLMRWLAEVIWFPYGFVSDCITWEAINPKKARAILRINGIEADLVFTLDKHGRFGSVSGERYYGEGEQKRPWKGFCREYREFGGFMVPSQIEVVWKLEAGDYSYARFHVFQLEYNSEQRFSSP